MFILDTDHLSILRLRSQPACTNIGQRMAPYHASVFFRSIVSFQEQVLGANAYVQQAANPASIAHGFRLVQSILSDYIGAQVLPFDQRTAVLFDSLRKQKVRIGTNDLRIAATALVLSFTVLTRNLRDFRRVPGLVVEDWTI